MLVQDVAWIDRGMATTMIHLCTPLGEPPEGQTLCHRTIGEKARYGAMAQLVASERCSQCVAARMKMEDERGEKFAAEAH